MERLTYKNGFGEWEAKCKSTFSARRDDRLTMIIGGNVLDRLAAYEDAIPYERLETAVSALEMFDKGYQSFEDWIIKKPKQGHWIKHVNSTQECSACGQSTNAFDFKFCPNCGARMDKEK